MCNKFSLSRDVEADVGDKIVVTVLVVLLALEIVGFDVFSEACIVAVLDVVVSLEVARPKSYTIDFRMDVAIEAL